MKRIGQQTIQQEAKGLQALAAKLDYRAFDKAVEGLGESDFVVFTGVGKSGHVARKLASTFVSLGTRAVFMHPTEAAHGDMGLLTNNCAMVALSRSGLAAELLPCMNYAAALGAFSVLITEREDTPLGLRATVVLKLPKVAEAWGHAPTTSTVMQMALGDALAVALAEVKGFNQDDFKLTHPGGELGKGT